MYSRIVCLYVSGDTVGSSVNDVIMRYEMMQIFHLGSRKIQDFDTTIS